MKKQLELLSMEELSRLSRNIGIDSFARQLALRELARRENRSQGYRGRRIRLTDYPAFTLL